MGPFMATKFEKCLAEASEKRAQERPDIWGHFKAQRAKETQRLLKVDYREKTR